MDTVIATDSTASPRHGRSWNQSLLQAHLAIALQRKYGDDFSVLPSLTLALDGQPMTPDLALFPGTANLVKPDTTLVAELPLTAIVILSSSQAFDVQVGMGERYLLAGVRSCWLIELTLQAISVTSSPGIYQTFDRNETLRDPATGIEVELAPLFG